MSLVYPLRRFFELAAKWPRFMVREARADGLDGVESGLRTTQMYLTTGVSRNFVSEIHNPGTPIWEDDWDVLLVLDACRADLMAEVVDEYAFLPPADELETRWSVGSMSSEWIRRTFVSDYRERIERSAYVTGNAFSSKVDFEVEPAILDEVWQYEWDDEVNTILPRSLTDRSIDTWRNSRDEIDQMVVHYMQPHVPFIPRPELGDYTRPEEFGDGFANIWNRIGEDFTLEEVWTAYRDNLRCVLDDVELLLENIDAERVAITADHGNAVGELGYYGHPPDILLPCLRRVPWIITEATDRNTYEPAIQPPDGDVETNVEDRLEDLGYL